MSGTSDAALERSTWSLTAAPPVNFDKLTGPQWRALQEALGDACPAYTLLQQFVKFRLEHNLNRIAREQNLDTALFDLIQWTQSRGWTERLFFAAREEFPDNPALTRFGLGVSPPRDPAEKVTLAESGFEAVLRKGAPQVKLVDLLRQLGEVEARVCRIDRDGGPMGTGFLVGDDAVMTCHHVVESLLDGADAPAQFSVCFDAHPRAEGTRVALADDWRIDASPPAEFERRGGERMLDEEHLDFAVLRLARAVGAEGIGAHPGQSSPPRGHVALPSGAATPVKGTALYIVQHPDGRSMEIALEMDGVADVDPTGTRLAHRVNTEPGSSGSPVFTFDGRLVALHHSGRSSVVDVSNQAIPIGAIRRCMERHKTLAALDR